MESNTEETDPAYSHYQKYGKKWYEKNKESERERGKNYYHSGGGKAVKQNRYREARRDAILKNRYGITGADYDKMFSQQEGKCAICFSDYSLADRALDVDHNHDTGEVRGLLCNNCNRGLGHFQDNPDLLLAAAKYITGKGGSCGV